MATKQLMLPGEIVKKSNAIARAKWQPESIWEPRIVALVASKVREADGDFLEYRIPVSELSGVEEKNLRGNQYREISKSIEHLGKATIRIQGEKVQNFRQYNIFAMCGYENGSLIAQFHPDLKPHFLNLKAQFTAYNLFEYLSLPSSYSQKLFELLKSWSAVGAIEIPLSELHDSLTVPQSLRENFKDFRRRVIDKAQMDITDKTSLSFTWEPIKSGKAVVSIRFIFDLKKIQEKRKEKEEKEQVKERKKNNKNVIQALACVKTQEILHCKRNMSRDVCNMCDRMELLSEYISKKHKI